MGIISFLGLFYLLFMIILYIKKNEVGNRYLFLGIMTFIFLILYISVPLFPWKLQRFIIFIDFSIMIMLFGITCGGLLEVFGVKKSISRLIAVISSICIIMILFNLMGIVSYLYIPILIYGIYNEILT